MCVKQAEIAGQQELCEFINKEPSEDEISAVEEQPQWLLAAAEQNKTEVGKKVRLWYPRDRVGSK